MGVRRDLEKILASVIVFGIAFLGSAGCGITSVFENTKQEESKRSSYFEKYMKAEERNAREERLEKEEEERRRKFEQEIEKMEKLNFGLQTGEADNNKKELGVYDVRDLTVNFSDSTTYSGDVQYNNQKNYGGGSSVSYGGKNYGSGYGGSGYSGYGNYGSGVSGSVEGGNYSSGYESGGGGSYSYGQDAVSRSQDLLFLITNLCGPGTWQEVGVIGGGSGGSRGYGGSGSNSGGSVNSNYERDNEVRR